MRESLIAHTSDETRAIGRALGAALLANPVGPSIITLEGELGAGKTTLVRGVLEAFGVVGAVRSPTYTLIEPYELPNRRVYHLDLYRLGSGGDLEGLGLRDLLDEDAVLLIEWPEKGGDRLPPVDLKLELQYSGEGRMIVFQSLTALGKRLADNDRASLR